MNSKYKLNRQLWLEIGHLFEYELCVCDVPACVVKQWLRYDTIKHGRPLAQATTNSENENENESNLLCFFFFSALKMICCHGTQNAGNRNNFIFTEKRWWWWWWWTLSLVYTFAILHWCILYIFVFHFLLNVCHHHSNELWTWYCAKDVGESRSFYRI